MKDVSFLVVDDCDMVRKVVSKIIHTRLNSQQVFTAVNGAEALKVLTQKPIDIIICDCEMPTMDGMALLKKLRVHERFSNIPFIMMSASGGREFVVEAIQMGVSQYVVKPFNPEKLEITVRKAWSGAHKRMSKRYSGLPTHRMTANIGGKTFEGQVSNISRAGMLFHTQFEPSLQLFSQGQLQIEFENVDDTGIVHLGPIEAKVVRLEADNALEDNNFTCAVATYFVYDKQEQQVRESLTMLLSNLNAKTLQVVRDE